jgi:uncharacterized membrane protein YkvA (DUF1232 family)
VKRFDRWKRRARELKQEVHALALACKDPRTPWHAKLLAVVIVGYALSPIDLIPDFIPVLGYLDDLILVPLGIYFVLRMIPDEVMTECREKVRAATIDNHRGRWFAAAVIVTIWIILGVIVVNLMIHAIWLEQK